jgi:hypothetical protein
MRKKRSSSTRWSRRKQRRGFNSSWSAAAGPQQHGVQGFLLGFDHVEC